MARKVMGSALVKGPKQMIYKDYVQLELGLREFDRARKPIIYWNGIQPIYSLDLIRGMRKRRYQILHQSLQNQDN